MRGPRGNTLYRPLILISAGRRKALTRLRSNQIYWELVAPTLKWDQTRDNSLKAWHHYASKHLPEPGNQNKSPQSNWESWIILTLDCVCNIVKKILTRMIHSWAIAMLGYGYPHLIMIGIKLCLPSIREMRLSKWISCFPAITLSNLLIDNQVRLTTQ